MPNAPVLVLAPPFDDSAIDDPLLIEAVRALERGHLELAEKSAIRAAERAGDPWSPEREAWSLLVAAEALLAGDRALEARPLLVSAAQRAVEAGSLRLEAGAVFGQALACFDLGVSKDGHDALLEAMDLFRQVADASGNDDDKWRLARAVRTYGEHLGVLGSSAEARQALELARIMFGDLGDEIASRAIASDLDELQDWER